MKRRKASSSSRKGKPVKRQRKGHSGLGQESRQRKGPRLRNEQNSLPFVCRSLEQPHPENWQTDIKEVALPVGPRCIQRLCERFLRRLGNDEQRSLSMFIQSGLFQTGSTHPVLTTSTICSGTDVSLLVASALADACSSVVGKPFMCATCGAAKSRLKNNAFSNECFPGKKCQ